MNKKVFIFIISSFFSILSHSSDEGVIQIDIEEIKEVKGTIIISLHNTEKTFLKGKPPFRLEKILVKSTSMTYHLKQVPYGEYAISLYQDLDGDGQLNSNFIGIPSEPVGVSRNAKGSFGPPKYQDSKFQLVSEREKLKIKLR